MPNGVYIDDKFTLGPPSEEYRRGWDRIFGKKVEVICTVEIGAVKIEDEGVVAVPTREPRIFIAESWHTD